MSSIVRTLDPKGRIRERERGLHLDADALAAVQRGLADAPQAFL